MNPTNINGMIKFPTNVNPTGEEIFSLGCASISTLAKRNFFINSGALTGSSTLIR